MLGMVEIENKINGFERNSICLGVFVFFMKYFFISGYIVLHPLADVNK